MQWSCHPSTSFHLCSSTLGITIQKFLHERVIWTHLNVRKVNFPSLTLYRPVYKNSLQHLAALKLAMFLFKKKKINNSFNQMSFILRNNSTSHELILHRREVNWLEKLWNKTRETSWRGSRLHELVSIAALILTVYFITEAVSIPCHLSRKVGYRGYGR